MSLLTKDIAVFFDSNEFAETISYNSASISAIVEREFDLADINMASWDSAKVEAIVTVKVSDVANPSYRDTVTIGSDTFRVFQRISGDGGTWTLALISEERPTI